MSKSLLFVVYVVNVLCMICSYFVFSMPYRVPLQGKAGGKRTLVILDDMVMLQQYSIFFGDMSSQGHELTYISSDSQDFGLKTYGEYDFDNIILFAPKANEIASVSFEEFHQFVEDGGNIFFGASNEISDSMRKFSAMCGVEFDKEGTAVFDNFFSIDMNDQSVPFSSILTKEIAKFSGITGDYVKSVNLPILFRGLGHIVDSTNVLSVKVLAGNPTTFSGDASGSNSPVNAGRDIALISAIQARNNARLLFSGSLDIFSNKFYTKTMESFNGNREFSKLLAKWVFNDAGVLRFREIHHSQFDGTPPDVILHEKERPDLPQTLYPDPEITRNSLVYRIKDEIVYSMIVEEYTDGEWKPFCVDDMQLEFVMLDPHVRKTMTCNPLTGKFVAQFTAPDNYGIFKFRVLYRRLGYSVLHSETQVSLRPFKHNEYERFISSAFPYYSAAISGIFGFVVFSLSFLFSS